MEHDGDAGGGGSRARRDALQRVNDGIVALDADFRYTYVNPRAERILGKTSDELLGNRIWDEFPEILETNAESEVREAMTSQRQRSFERYSPELDRWLDVRLYPDEGGLSILFTDISENRQRERELRELSEKYEAIFETAKDAFFLVDVDRTDEDVEFRFERLNPAHEAGTGLESADVAAKTPREVLGPELGGEVAANYRRCLEAREPITYEEELPLPAGRRIWQTNLAPVVVDGDVTRIVGIGRDVTDRVERERELRRKNERLDEFASVISHDLRNPLNVAQARTTFLEEECDQEYHEHLDPLARALARMEAIVRDTLTLARHGETVAETERINMTDMIGHCWGMVDTDDATLERVDEFAVAADRERLRHVFENLFGNAVEHAGAGVTVRVGRLGTDGFYVEDDGPGISEADRETVFEAGHTSATGGTGFGLTIVKRIAEAHGWGVALTAAADGGARFEFTGVDVDDSARRRGDP